ncbi:MAG: calcium-binding protein, partial [Cupriavidus sp.]
MRALGGSAFVSQVDGRRKHLDAGGMPQLRRARPALHRTRLFCPLSRTGRELSSMALPPIVSDQIVVKVIVHYTTGNDTVGSGILIDPTHVLTAQHVVDGYDEYGNHRTITSIEFIPNYDGTQPVPPGDKHLAAQIWFPRNADPTQAINVSANDIHYEDLALVRLATAVDLPPERFPSLGVFVDGTAGANLSVFSRGYSADGGLDGLRMRETTGTLVGAAQTGMFGAVTGTEVYGGASGSGVLTSPTVDLASTLIGILTNGSDKSPHIITASAYLQPADIGFINSKLVAESGLTDVNRYQPVQFFGSMQGDLLNGTARRDIISGGDGVDYIGDGDSLSFGVNDQLAGEGGDDVIVATGGNDQLIGGKGHDTLEGGAGDDVLMGGYFDEAADIVNDDRNIYDGANDKLNGGEGYDTYIVAGGEEIRDTDGKGAVYANLFKLSGGQFLRRDAEFPTFVDSGVPDSLGWVDGLVGFVFTVIRSAAANLGYRFEDLGIYGSEDEKYYVDAGKLKTGQDLIIRFNDTNIVIRDWKNGDLGITINPQSAGDSPLVATGQVEPYGTLAGLFTPNLTFKPNALSTKGGGSYLGTSGDDILVSSDGNDLLFGGDGNDSLHGGEGVDEVDGGAGADYLTGGEGNDILRGGDGADEINGNGGNDQIRGGKGADIIYGSTGKDVFYFDRGDGQDTLWVVEDGEIRLGAGIDAATVTVTETSQSLTLNLGGGDSIFLTEALLTSGQIRIVFADGSVWNNQTLLDKVLVATTGADNLTGDIRGNLIQGGAGNDMLDGKAGDDVMVGGTGNDTLHGSLGDDRYVFNVGDGQDVIAERFDFADWAPNPGQDVLSLGAGITPGQVTLSTADNGRDLVVTIGSNGDKVTIDQQFADPSNRVETIEFSTGETWSYEEMLARANTATSGADTLYGDERANRLDGLAGTDTLTGRAGGDTYVFGRGYGADVINDGGADGEADVIVFAADVASTEVLARQANNGADIILSISGTSDQLTIVGAGTEGGKIEEVRFADGARWTYADLFARAAAGTSGDDTLFGDGLANDLSGGGGADLLRGLGGNDVLRGGAGADTLVGGAGDDVYIFNLGDGQDQIYDDSADGAFIGGDDQDELRLGAGITTSNLIVSQTTDGLGLKLSVSGTSDAVTLTRQISQVTLYSMSRIERVVFSDGTVWTHADLMARSTTPTTGADNFIGDENANLIRGGDGADTLRGADGDDVLDGGAGNDSLDGGAGFDQVSYEPAASAVTVTLPSTGSASSVTTGAAGTDTFTSIEGLIGSAFNDALTGGGGNDRIEGGLGNDTLVGGGGVDTVSYAGASAGVTVSLALTTAQNTVSAGSDTISGFEDVLGSAFDDRLTGDANANTLTGGAGDDVLDGGAGADLLRGQAGRDTASYASAAAGVSVDLSISGAQSTGGAGSDTLEGIENLSGSAFNDTLTGDANANVLEGGAGNDTLNGGDGRDTASYAGATAAVSVNLATSGSQNTGGAGSDTLSNIE